MSQSAKHLYIHQNDPVEVARQLAAKWQTTAVERDRAGGSATAERERCAPAACSPCRSRKNTGAGAPTGRRPSK